MLSHRLPLAPHHENSVEEDKTSSLQGHVSLGYPLFASVQWAWFFPATCVFVMTANCTPFDGVQTSNLVSIVS